jgi:DNA-binding GntR family transcriptional regulator
LDRCTQRDRDGIQRRKVSSEQKEKPRSRRPALAATAYDQIRRDLLFGDLANSPRLAEQELAKRYRMSRTPVREALQRLALAGFLASGPGGGYLPHRVSARDLREIHELRILLEPLAARLAVHHMTTEHEAYLSRLSQEGKTALHSRKASELPKLNAEFHSVLATASGNATLARVLAAITDRLAAHHVFATGNHDGQDQLITGHEEIVSAIRARDEDAAAKAVTSHLENARHVLGANQ